MVDVNWVRLENKYVYRLEEEDKHIKEKVCRGTRRSLT